MWVGGVGRDSSRVARRVSVSFEVVEGVGEGGEGGMVGVVLVFGDRGFFRLAVGFWESVFLAYMVAVLVGGIGLMLGSILLMVLIQWWCGVFVHSGRDISSTRRTRDVCCQENSVVYLVGPTLLPLLAFHT